MFGNFTIIEKTGTRRTSHQWGRGKGEMNALDDKDSVHYEKDYG